MNDNGQPQKNIKKSMTFLDQLLEAFNKLEGQYESTTSQEQTPQNTASQTSVPQNETTPSYCQETSQACSRWSRHTVVLERMATDIAVTLAKDWKNTVDYCLFVNRAFSSKLESILVSFFPSYIELGHSSSYVHFASYGMGNLNESDIEEFRQIFQPFLETAMKKEISKWDVSNTLFWVEYYTTSPDYGQGPRCSLELYLRNKDKLKPHLKSW